MNERAIVELLERDGPLTGAELVERTRGEVFALWLACKQAPSVRLEIIGRRFLRLDRVVQGYARLSPSIRREFLTYTLLGLESHPEVLFRRARLLKEETRRISKAKLELARESVASAVDSLPDKDSVLPGVCFIIAGDITYEMSHVVPRPEKSTGEMVRGSDLDIIVIADSGLPEESVRRLDRAIYKKKHYLLVHPDYREEIDYILKNLDRVREQLRFDTFESMVACKILHEGEYLYGSNALFRTIKELVGQHAMPEKLRQMELQATAFRDQAEARLLQLDGRLSETEAYHLFYTKEEGEEIY